MKTLLLTTCLFVLSCSGESNQSKSTVTESDQIFGSCQIVGDKMVGYIHNNSSSSIWLSGDVEFKLYDRDFDLLYTYSTRKSGSVSRGVRELADQRIYSSDLDDAASCSFDVSDAIGETPDPINYQVFCVIRGDEAIGSVRYTSGLSYFGKVYLKIFDEDGDLLDDYSTTKSGSNGGSGVVKVLEYRMSSSDIPKAKSCSFDISEAIRD